MSVLVEKQNQFFRLFLKLSQFILDQGYEASFGDAYRSTDQLKCCYCDKTHSYQELLKFNSKSKVSHSAHNDRCAIDLVIRKNGIIIADSDYKAFGGYWETGGGTWGGRFGVKKEEYGNKIGWDAGHFEL